MPNYNQAVDAVLRTGIPSVAVLHREIGCGYKLAAVFLDRMEKLGVVTKIQGGQRYVVEK